MRKIFFFIILLILISFISGCSAKAEETEQYIDYSEYLEVFEERNNLKNKYNILKQDYDNLKNESISKIYELIKEKNKIENYWRNELITFKQYLNIYPTSCKNPRNIRVLNVLSTGSMRPLFGENAEITIANCDNYEVGDIIYIPLKDEQIKKHCIMLTGEDCDFVLHQIVEKNDLNITTKGTNNDYVDNWTTKISEIEGKVINIEY